MSNHAETATGDFEMALIHRNLETQFANSKRSILLSWLLFALLAVLPSPSASAEKTLVVDDPLAGKTVGRKFGGSFQDSVYRPRKGENHILYVLPKTIEEGEVVFEVKGVNPDRIDEKEHGFACMYDGYKMAEPIKYSPEFKYNFYRFNMHWRKNKNAIKCVVNIATDEKKKLAVDDRPMFPTDGKMEWRQEPTGKGYPFQEDRWYRIRIGWEKNKIGTSIEELDGSNRQTVWDVRKPLPYTPKLHCIRIGSGPGKYSSALENIQYRNVKIYSNAKDAAATGQLTTAGKLPIRKVTPVLPLS